MTVSTPTSLTPDSKGFKGQLSEKAIRYLAQLDQARCEGRWSEVPELARKVEKHAPQRTCLAVTARAEATIALHGSQRPVNTPVDQSTPSIAELLGPLEHEREKRGVLPEDAFEASVCMAWIHLLRGEPQLAVSRLPDDFAGLLKAFLEGERTIGQWVRVCAIKGAYIKGHALEKTNAITPAAQTYLSMLPYLSSFTSFKATNPQFCLWTQCLLTRLCVLASSPNAPNTGIDLNTTLWMFRTWHSFWMSSIAPAQLGESDPRRQLGYLWRDVWFAYYQTLSDIMQKGWHYTPGQTIDTPPRILESSEHLSHSEYLASRLRQRADLKSIEAINESFLLKETRFPKATDRNEDVEAWAEAVMRNWRVMCGPSWQDDELGEGGKNGVARGVLDILYRAATKTFQSTQILRYLFIVHAALAEFDLAFKAFDSYVEIITRGKDRAEKSGEVDPSLDDDSTVLRTSSEAVRLLCRFGGMKEAEKAKEIGDRIEKWLKQQTPAAPPSRSSRGDPEGRTESVISPRAIAISYQAIGMSQANWARLTYDAKARATFQAHAVDCYRQALHPKYEDSQNIQTRYALALLLAEMRDISDAIKVVKQALGPVANSVPTVTPDGWTADAEKSEESQGYLQERKSVPLWHLLSLLLTARSDFETAGRVCDAAFEQFKDPSILFGSSESEQFQSEHLKQISASMNSEKPSAQRRKGIVDVMESFEKEGLLQVKLTQLLLVEAIDGSSVAVDSCEQLLALYSRLFGDPSARPATSQTAKPVASPPRTSHTFRESLFGRNRNSKRTSFRPKSSLAPSNASILSRPSTVATAAGAPTIQVIDEEGKEFVQNGSLRNTQRHSLLHLPRSRQTSPRPSSRRSESVKLRKRGFPPQTADGGIPPPIPADAFSQNKSISPTQPSFQPSDAVEPTYHAISGDEEHGSTGQSLPPVAHNISEKDAPPPPGQHEQPPKQDVRLPAPFPHPARIGNSSVIEPRFPSLQDRRHRISLLVQVWLFIAGLYTRAALFDDAKGAAQEAAKLVQSIEADQLKETPSVKGLADRRWGTGKSIEGLWGDVWAEHGHLFRARGRPHDAVSLYERALSHFPDHPSATVGLAEILLDIYAQKITPELAEAGSLLPSVFPPTTQGADTAPAATPAADQPLNTSESMPPEKKPDDVTQTRHKSASPEELNRLAARDRAYGLLSSLTKLGSGWDYSDAWFALARAYEEGGQVEKAKEVLWWTVELEDTRPIRAWEVVGLGGGSL